MTEHTMHGVAGTLVQKPHPNGLWQKQKFIAKREIRWERKKATITVEARFDDECGNKHNTFAVTGHIRIPGSRDLEVGGCIHEEIAKYFPELKHLIQWHLVSTDGPMHYIANTTYHASNRDLDAARSTACWPEATDEQLCLPKEELTALLEARLPELMERFKNDIVAAGFAWAPEE